MLELPEKGKIIVAIDEAGRGCLAFEVVAAAVVFPPHIDLEHDSEITKQLESIKDSKKLSAKKRDKLSEFIKDFTLAYGIGVSTSDEIDRLNILQATYNAMHRALDEVVEKLDGCSVDHIMVDGDRFKPYIAPNGMNWIQHTCVPSGDDIHMNIAAASILAKTHRDHLVETYVEQDPTLKEKYGFDKNKAYGTAKHIEGLKKYGATKYHRKSFAPVRLYA